jgi:hypothetical protein
MGELDIREQLVTATPIDLGCGGCSEKPEEKCGGSGDEKSSAHGTMVPVMGITAG